MNNAQKDELVNWMILNHEAIDIIHTVKESWVNLLEDKSQPEETYHSFLAEHAGFFFADYTRKIPIISKLQLGADFVTDFVVANDYYSCNRSLPPPIESKNWVKNNPPRSSNTS